MDDRERIASYAVVYSALLWLLPSDQKKRFGPEMELLFRDRLDDCMQEGKPLWRQALWMFGETLNVILREGLKVALCKHALVLRMGAITLSILILPLIGAYLSDEVRWTLFDFTAAGALIFGTGLAFSLFLRRCKSVMQRSAVGLALASTLLHIWVNGSVGMVGPETDPFNALYYLVPAAGSVGGAAGYLRPRRLAWVMMGMAAIQAGLGVLALALEKHGDSSDGALEVVGGTVLFMVLFLASAWLFLRSPSGDKRAA